jgi:hypothetical protein
VRFLQLQSLTKRLKLAEPNGVLAQYKLCTSTVKCSQPKCFSQPKLEPKRSDKRIDQ